MANEAGDAVGISMYAMLRSAKLYEAREDDTTLTKDQIQWFFKGYDAHESAIRTAAEALAKFDAILDSVGFVTNMTSGQTLREAFDALKAALAKEKE